jgi:hypothetical protein
MDLKMDHPSKIIVYILRWDQKNANSESKSKFKSESKS